MRIIEKLGDNTTLRPSEMILEIGKTRDALLRVLCLDADNALKTAVKLVSEYYDFNLSFNDKDDVPENVLVRIEETDDEDFPYCLALYTGTVENVHEFFETREDAITYVERLFKRGGTLDTVNTDSTANSDKAIEERFGGHAVKFADNTVLEKPVIEKLARYYTTKELADKLGITEELTNAFLCALGLECRTNDGEIFLTMEGTKHSFSNRNEDNTRVFYWDAATLNQLKEYSKLILTR